MEVKTSMTRINRLYRSPGLIAGLVSMLLSLREQLGASAETGARVAITHARPEIGEELEQESRRHFGQMATFNQLVAGGVTLIVGVLVYNEVYDATPTVSGGVDRGNVTGTVNQAFELAPVALIVLIAVVILARVTSMT